MVIVKCRPVFENQFGLIRFNRSYDWLGFRNRHIGVCGVANRKSVRNNALPEL